LLQFPLQQQLIDSPLSCGNNNSPVSNSLFN